MITGELKSKIDKLWEEFWTGGITNPLTVIEQITFLMYARLLDMNERRDEKKEQRSGQPFKRRFAPDQQSARWESFRHLPAEQMYKVVKDEVFPHFKDVAGEGSLFAEFMRDAQLMVQKPSLLVKAVNMLSELPLQESDMKGDLYEYLLSKLTTAGISGQFRTPRHIIRAIVEMLDPEATYRIADPACGTGGFLATTYEYLLEKYSSKETIITEKVTNEKGEEVEQKIYSGNLLQEYRHHVDTDMFHGFDFDSTMLRIAAMNLVMHGITQPDIHYQDTLSQRFSERFPKAAKEGFDLILANPPFKGALDEEDVDPVLLRTVRTKKTELLFVALIMKMLKVGGRSATIVPDGVLFGSSRAHQELRKHLVDDNQLEAVISLPSGVFKPYAGVSTAILFFTKGGKTDHVWFYGVKADGRTLDDRRQEISENDLPDLVEQFRRRDKSFAGTEQNDRSAKAFWVCRDEIFKNKFDLSIARYQEQKIELESYEPPNVILKQLRALEAEVSAGLDDLEALL